MNPFVANVAVDLFLRGGPIMWPILGALLLALVVLAERALWWADLRRRSDPERLRGVFDAIADGDFDRASDLSSSTSDPFLNTIQEGLLHAHSSMLGAMQLK